MKDMLSTAHFELCALVGVYMDDLIIATEGEGLTEEDLVAQHEKQVNQVMGNLDANQLSLVPKKGPSFLQSVKLCGSLLENGTRSDGNEKEYSREKCYEKRK